MVRIFVWVMLVFISVSLQAATISVRTDRPVVSINESFQMFFTVQGQQQGEPDFSPLNQDFELHGQGQSTSVSIVNGRMSQTQEYTLSVTAKREGKLPIPAIAFGADKSAPASIVVQAASAVPQQQANSTQGQAKQAQPELMFMTAELDSKSAYVQQQVLLTLKIYRRARWADVKLTPPRFEGVEVMSRQLGKEKAYRKTHNGLEYEVIELNYALTPQESGTVQVLPFQLLAEFAAGRQRQRSPLDNFFNDPFGQSLFSRQSYVRKEASSEAITLDVLPVPAAYKGDWLAARDVSLQESWSQPLSDLKPGEPVTRTIAVIADGAAASQLPEITMSAVDGIKVYPDQPVSQEQVTPQGVISTVTYKFAVIPSRGGNISLPAIKLPWWDVVNNKQAEAVLPAGKMNVQAAPQSMIATQPAAQEPVESPVKESKPESASKTITIEQNYVLAAAIIFAALWILTLLAWWLSQRKKTIRHQQSAGKAEENQQVDLRLALQQLQKACKQGDAEQVSICLINWINSVNPRAVPATSLNDVAEQVSTTLAEEVKHLSRARYANGTHSWNADKIALEAEKYMAAVTDKAGGKMPDEALAPLYR